MCHKGFAVHAVAGYSAGDGTYAALPGSGSGEALKLAQLSFTRGTPVSAQSGTWCFSVNSKCSAFCGQNTDCAEEPFSCTCKNGYAVAQGQNIAYDGCAGKLAGLGAD